MCRLNLPQESAKPLSSRRKRLWELPERCYCLLVGVCFGIEELRRLLQRQVNFPADTSDYDVHALAVQLGQQRTPVAELLQRELEKRYALTVASFKKAKTREQLQALWLEALPTAHVRGALWAAWTHPCCDDEINQLVYTGIHMLQHQLGDEHRHDLRHVKKLEEENLALARELAQVQARFTEFRDDKRVTIARLQQQLQEKDQELRHQSIERERLAEIVSGGHSPHRLLHDLALAQQKLLDAEERLLEQTQRMATLVRDAEEVGKEKKWLEQELAALLRQQFSSCSSAALDVSDLAGQCVLCVGGRSGAVDIYRGLVERLGGKFIHHDGGMEESIHRLEANISSADAVICQAGCISHNAYWLVKDLCKRNGKPCIFARKPSVSAFLHGLERLEEKSSGDDKLAGVKTIRILPC